MASRESGGPAEQINYFPQAASQNQLPGTWRNMEIHVRDLKLNNPGDIIKLEIAPVFSGSSKRPIGFDIQVSINGDIHVLPNEYIYIPNP